MPDLRWPKITGLSGIACDPSLSENHGLYEVSRACKEKREKKIHSPKTTRQFWKSAAAGVSREDSRLCLILPTGVSGGLEARYLMLIGIHHTRSWWIRAKCNNLLKKKQQQKKTNQQHTETPTDKLNLSQVCYDGNKVCLPGGTCSFPPKHQEGQADK